MFARAELTWWITDSEPLRVRVVDPLPVFPEIALASGFATDATGDYRWDLSPDGYRVAILRNREGRIQILSLKGRPPHEITMKGWNLLTNVNWTADGEGLFVASLNERGSVLLRVDLKGNARVLWEQMGGGRTYGVPSPDGRHIAMMAGP